MLAGLLVLMMSAMLLITDVKVNQVRSVLTIYFQEIGAHHIITGVLTPTTYKVKLTLDKNSIQQ